MRSTGTLYIIAAMVFGFLTPLLKVYLTEWWQVALVAAVYFAVASFAASRIARKHEDPGAGPE